MLKYLIEFGYDQGIFGAIALVLFMIAFIMIVVHTIKLNRDYLQRMEEMPLEGDEDHVKAHG